MRNSYILNYLPNTKILDCSKLKAFADNKIIMNLKIEIHFGKGRKVENILGNGKNTGTSIFSFSHNVFKMLLCLGRLNSGLCGKRLKQNGLLTHSHTMTPFDAPGKQAFRKHCGKRRNCS